MKESQLLNAHFFFFFFYIDVNRLAHNNKKMLCTLLFCVKDILYYNSEELEANDLRYFLD